MSAVVDTVMLVFAVALAIPSAVYAGECLLAAVLGRPKRTPAPTTVVRTVILMPAHDEADGLAHTLRQLSPHLESNVRLLVVADNCSDDTAAIARQHGVDVVERHDAQRRGKGHAIAFGVQSLRDDPPEVVVVLDADCELAAGSLARVTELAVRSGRPVQADYLLQAPPDASALTRISAFAFLVRNRVRPLGMHWLGLPCHLTGSGMAFPWEVLRAAPGAGSNLVEDLWLGLELAKQGHPPLLCPRAEVTSLLPTRGSAAFRQRTRWEHGQLGTLFQLGPSLLRAGLLRRRFGLVALAFDLLVPPLASLVVMLVLLTAATTIHGAAHDRWTAFVVVVASLAIVVLATLAAWLRFARDSLPLRSLVAAPLYVAWKLPMYVAWLVRKRQTTWERTERTAPAKSEDRA